MSYIFTHTITALIKKTEKNIYWHRYGKNGILLSIAGGNIKWCGLCGGQFASPQKIKQSLITWPAILFLGIYPRETKTFPDSSVSKESACSVGDPGSIPGSERSTGEGTGYPLQYSWASLVAQLVKNPPAMRGTWVRSLGREDPLEQGKATHSSILAWRIPGTV